MTRTITADVGVSGAGTIYLFHLLTEAARDWVACNVSDDHQMSGAALAVEHRYVAALAAGMIADGLVLSDKGAF